MEVRDISLRLVLAGAVALAACHDADEPLDPQAPERADIVVPGTQQAGGLGPAAMEVMELPQTVFADRDEATGRLIFGVENAGVANAIQTVMERRGIPSSGYRVQVTEPIHFATTLRDRHRPTIGGVQIHFGNYLCTLGFNADHADGRSFITNSHCTNTQGGTEGTQYYQPTSSVDGTAIAVEADDPEYFRGGGCSRGKKCRYSDASRALYDGGTASSRGVIGKTTGENSGSLTLASSNFTITSQDNNSMSFGGTVHKVGRTTGWTSGNVTNTCVTVNVSGSNVQLLCQTIVQRSGTRIVGGGDSGSNVFRITSGDNVELVGILWGGNSSGDLFVFSPLRSIQDELGSLTATSGGGTTNQAPTASFTYSCTDLSCSFDGSGSSDSDGTIVSHSWTFGDGGSGSGATPSHTYAAGGTYTVTLTVTDNDNATDDVSKSVTVSSSSGGFTLTATGSKVKGTKSADLSWTGGSADEIDVYRDGSVVATTANDGAYTDTIGKGGGSHTYQVCDAGTATCSNTVTLDF